MNPFLKWPERGSLIGQRAQSNRLAVGENDFQAKHHVGDPTVSRHTVADTALIDHGANHHRRSISSEVWQHQTMLTERVMNPIDAGAALGDDILHGWIDFENLIHAEHVEQNAALERRADAHADAAFGDDGNFVLVGELKNVGDLVIAGLSVGLDAHDDIRQRPVSAVSEGVLIIDLVDRIRRNPAWADDFRLILQQSRQG